MTPPMPTEPYERPLVEVIEACLADCCDRRISVQAQAVLQAIEAPGIYGW